MDIEIWLPYISIFLYIFTTVYNSSVHCYAYGKKRFLLLIVYICLGFRVAFNAQLSRLSKTFMNRKLTMIFLFSMPSSSLKIQDRESKTVLKYGSSPTSSEHTIDRHLYCLYLQPSCRFSEKSSKMKMISEWQLCG